ncbi:mCG141049, partial [Mus musculus]
ESRGHGCGISELRFSLQIRGPVLPWICSEN